MSNRPSDETFVSWGHDSFVESIRTALHENPDLINVKNIVRY